MFAFDMRLILIWYVTRSYEQNKIGILTNRRTMIAQLICFSIKLIIENYDSLE